MPPINTINHNNGFVKVWKIEETVDEILAELQVSDDDLQKVNSFKLVKRKLEFLCTRCLISEVIGVYPKISYLESGKPILENSDYTISISHTNGFVAVAFTTNGVPGVDIEYPSDRVMKIAQRFISADEDLFIPVADSNKYYSLIWCIKEALYKLLDTEGVIFNEDLLCKPFVISNQGIVNTSVFVNDSTEYINIHYLITPEYYLAYKV
ncbi:4'-phosphopantetheinyl transferase family protein [Saccharicrinis aurantiacus]|uniref:4'-phosphopantetheinyl transferase family protein n=1 Tax=Saccharicrinis aurantiacus TaxID=1849719 RepID=UPI000838A975|nr:4'-phosphopantetheinyl transferase superfamily protein [Saccharicrinis aurantiacus]